LRRAAAGLNVAAVRVEAVVSAISWIPSEALEGLPSAPFELGFVRYDDPPPDAIGDLGSLRGPRRFRVAHELRAWLDVERGEIVGHGHEGRVLLGELRVEVGPARIAFPPAELPLLERDPDVGDGSVRFVQTGGGRLDVPALRRLRLVTGAAWTQLELVVRADGRTHGALVGASAFPRHWLYVDGRLTAKSATLDYARWVREPTPWDGAESGVLVTAAETELERSIAQSLMTGTELPRRRLAPGEALVEQGTTGTELFLLLDGLLEAIVDGEVVAQIGPGALVGERAQLAGGVRSATLRAATACRLLVAPAEAISRYERASLVREREAAGGAPL